MANKHLEELEYYIDNGWLKEFKYQRAFVKFEKDAKSCLVIVRLDGFYVDSFVSKANTGAEFIRECDRVGVIRDDKVGYTLEFEEGF